MSIWPTASASKGWEGQGDRAVLVVLKAFQAKTHCVFLFGFGQSGRDNMADNELANLVIAPRLARNRCQDDCAQLRTV
jgi:hypothetical protein